MSTDVSTTAVRDIGALYGALSGRLEQIVRWDVRAQDAVIEDACQFAWSRLVHHPCRVESDSALPWLARTAIHEAFRQIRRDQREQPLDEELESGPIGPAPQELIEQRERIALLRSLPERQQRFLWLRAAGLSHSEIARHEACTRRTVERQLLRAKRGMKRAAGE